MLYIAQELYAIQEIQAQSNLFRLIVGYVLFELYNVWLQEWPI